MHRFVWDLHEEPPRALEHDYPISAIVHDTPREPAGPLVVPGRFTVRLRSGGLQLEQPLEVRMDPRVPVSHGDLVAQHALAGEIVAAMRFSAVPKVAALARQNAAFAQLLDVVESADAAPTEQAHSAFTALRAQLDTAIRTAH